MLFLQHVIDSLKPGGRCGIVLDEGVLFRTNENAFVQTKKKLLDDCDLWCIVSLPGGVFNAAGAGVKTNLLVPVIVASGVGLVTVPGIARFNPIWPDADASSLAPSTAVTVYL